MTTTTQTDTEFCRDTLANEVKRRGVQLADKIQALPPTDPRITAMVDRGTHKLLDVLTADEFRKELQPFLSGGEIHSIRVYDEDGGYCADCYPSTEENTMTTDLTATPVHALSLSCQALAMIDGSTDPIRFHGQPVIGFAAEMKRRGEHVYVCEDIGHMARHEIDEPCPDGCPTRLAEIAWYVSEHGAAGGAVTEDDVQRALGTAPEARDDVQRLIAEVEADWT